MNITFSSTKYKASPQLQKYITKKISKLTRYIPKHARVSAQSDIHLKEEKGNKNSKYICEVVLHLPQERLVAQEETMNMYAAVDIVEAKLKNQLLAYKNKAEKLNVRRSKVWSLIRRKKGL